MDKAGRGLGTTSRGALAAAPGQPNLCAICGCTSITAAPCTSTSPGPTYPSASWASRRWPAGLASLPFVLAEAPTSPGWATDRLSPRTACGALPSRVRLVRRKRSALDPLDPDARPGAEGGAAGDGPGQRRPRPQRRLGRLPRHWSAVRGRRHRVHEHPRQPRRLRGAARRGLRGPEVGIVGRDLRRHRGHLCRRRAAWLAIDRTGGWIRAVAGTSRRRGTDPPNRRAAPRFARPRGSSSAARGRGRRPLLAPGPRGGIVGVLHVLRPRPPARTPSGASCPRGRGDPHSGALEVRDVHRVQVGQACRPGADRSCGRGRRRRPAPRPDARRACRTLPVGP